MLDQPGLEFIVNQERRLFLQPVREPYELEGAVFVQYVLIAHKVKIIKSRHTEFVDQKPL